MKYIYYPGCSLKGGGRSYEDSMLAVFRALGVEVEEMVDWNCCGATAEMAVDEPKAFAMAARNLALAEKAGLDVVAPCAGCYLVLEKARRYLADYPELSRKGRQGLREGGLDYEGRVRVRHPLELLYKEIGPRALGEKVKTPLTGLRVAPYYGCQIIRPYSSGDNPENPVFMDELLAAVGVTLVEYPPKTKCCGAMITGSVPEIGVEQVYHLLREARRREADCIATVCSLCAFNLEAYQPKIAGQYGDVTMPVAYATQLIGLALGVPEKDLGLGRHLVPLKPALARRSLLAS